MLLYINICPVDIYIVNTVSVYNCIIMFFAPVILSHTCTCVMNKYLCISPVPNINFIYWTIDQLCILLMDSNFTRVFIIPVLLRILIYIMLCNTVLQYG